MENLSSTNKKKLNLILKTVNMQQAEEKIYSESVGQKDQGTFM